MYVVTIVAHTASGTDETNFAIANERTQEAKATKAINIKTGIGFCPFPSVDTKAVDATIPNPAIARSIFVLGCILGFEL